PNPSPAQIVGIARTAKYHEMEESPLPFMYVPLSQSTETFMYLFVASKDDPAAVIPVIKRAMLELDPKQPIYDVQTLADTVRRQALWADILGANIATGAGVTGLFLGILGLYGMLSYAVSQRTREIGIRMAIGATTGNVSRMVVLQGIRLSAAGI